MDLYEQFPRSRLNLDPEFEQLLERCRERHVCCLDLIYGDAGELTSRLELPILVIKKFVKLIDLEPLGAQVTRTQQMFSTGDPAVDRMLGGGILTGAITEIFGESATGKSQFCMQLCESVQGSRQHGGLEGSAVYISTESIVETKRMREISSHLDNIFVINCNDIETQEQILSVQLPILVKQHNVKLVVVDSVSHHLRLENNQNKNKIVNRMLSHLLDLAIESNLSVVLTNQISDLPNREVVSRLSNYYQIGWLNGWANSDIKKYQQNISCRSKVNALGLEFNNFIDTKIMLGKYYLFQEDETWELHRFLKVIYSPISNYSEIEFSMEKNGIKTHQELSEKE